MTSSTPMRAAKPRMPNGHGVPAPGAKLRPIAYVMEQTLGNTTHYLNIRAAQALDPVPPRWLPIEFQSSVVPWTVNGGWRARRAIAPVLDEVDGVFIHTMTLALGSLDLFGKKPFVVSSDATPIAKRHMREAYGLRPQLALSERVKRALYCQMFDRSAGFVAWSSWAKESLVRDYGCRDEDVAVISPGVDVGSFAPGAREHALPRILFVGGDFVRKGGDVLLEVFRKHLRGRAELILVTRDRVSEEPGVRVRNDLNANAAELRELFATSDVFALPTRADCYALVCMEALASGLPVVTTRVGGLRDMVVEGETGHVIDVDDARALAESLVSIALDAGKRTQMARAAREHALQRFDARVNARQLFEFVRSRC